MTTNDTYVTPVPAAQAPAMWIGGTRYLVGAPFTNPAGGTMYLMGVESGNLARFTSERGHITYHWIDQ